MKRARWLLLPFLPLAVRADWKDLRSGMDAQTVAQLLGSPLIVNHARGNALIMWTYDRGGYVMFVGNRLDYWEPSRTNAKVATPGPAPAQPGAAVAEVPPQKPRGNDTSPTHKT